MVGATFLILAIAAAPKPEITKPPTRMRQLLLSGKHPNAVAVLDLTADSTDLNRTLFFPVPTTGVQDDIRNLMHQTTDQGKIAVLDALKSELAATSNRWISTRGDTVDIYIFYRGDEPDVTVREDARDTRLATDLATLARIVTKTAIAGEGSISVTLRHYQLTKVRATLALSATQKADNSTTTAEKSIITGPTEHLFLSADVLVTRVSELQYDQMTHTFTTRDAPTAYHAGFDYMLGDVLTTDQREVWEGIVLKVLMKISGRPLDSYGVGLGYRSPNITILGMTLQSFTPFAGYFWTRVTEKDPAGNPVIRRKNTFGAGISFNLDKALSWAGKK